MRETANEAETVISASVKVEGEFVSQGNILIEGVVEGTLKTERDLRVGQKARIAADVSAANANVAGEVHGNLNVSERLELEPTAKIFGDIRTKILVVASGAAINGKIAMGQEAAEPRAKQAGAVQPQEKAKPAVKAVEKTEVEEKEKNLAGFFGR